jgi:hypothetical protein
MMEASHDPLASLDVPDATFACRDLTTFARLDEPGLKAVGQRLEPDWAVAGPSGRGARPVVSPPQRPGHLHRPRGRRDVAGPERRRISRDEWAPSVKLSASPTAATFCAYSAPWLDCRELQPRTRAHDRASSTSRSSQRPRTGRGGRAQRFRQAHYESSPSVRCSPYARMARLLHANGRREVRERTPKALRSGKVSGPEPQISTKFRLDFYLRA